MYNYQLRFWFEHGGTCLWGMNDYAKRKYGYQIKNNALPISEDLMQELNTMEIEYSTYLDWADPINPSPWTIEHKKAFVTKADIIYKKLVTELGAEYDIENKVNECVV